MKESLLSRYTLPGCENEVIIECCFSKNNPLIVEDHLNELCRLEAKTVGNEDRRAYATQDLRAGQQIVRNAPFALIPHEAKENCANCFRKPSKRCSQCQQVWYCDRTCQLEDFPFHRIECRETRTIAGDDNAKINARLLIRTFLKLHQAVKDGSNDDHTCQIDDDGICRCSRRHFKQLQASRRPHLDTHELLSIHLARTVLQQQSSLLKRMGIDIPRPDSILESIFRRFRPNNFGIMNDMLRLTGSGVYPLAALLNHSCAPNCFLRYTTTGVLEIIAACDILAGTELTHSYVELVAPARVRQDQLQNIYGFTCSCMRCMDNYIMLPENYKDCPAEELVDWVLTRQSSLNLHQTGQKNPLVNISLDNLLEPSLADDVLEEVENLHQQAKLAVVQENLEAELSALSKAIHVLVGTSPFSMKAYQLLGQRLSSWLIAQQWGNALADCKHVVAFLCLALSLSSNHPLLGLQLFTLGDLYEAKGEINHAIATHQWAYQVLSVSQGTESSMVRMLKEKLKH